jgi:SAM-dependent methyltransferase
VLARIDGVRLPLATGSVDLIWVCGVLRYSLLVEEPRHAEIVAEFDRVLRPGGFVCNVELYVDRPAAVFERDFAAHGFEVHDRRPVHVHRSRFEALALGRLRALFLRRWWARLAVAWTRRNVAEAELGRAIRDYGFVYRKRATMRRT